MAHYTLLKNDRLEHISLFRMPIIVHIDMGIIAHFTLPLRSLLSIDVIVIIIWYI